MKVGAGVRGNGQRGQVRALSSGAEPRPTQNRQRPRTLRPARIPIYGLTLVLGARSSAIPGQTGPEAANAGQKAAFKPAWKTTVLINLDSAVEQQSHEDAKVGTKGIQGISPKLEAFTWQVNLNHPSNLPLPGFPFASSRLCCSPPIAGFRINPSRAKRWAGPLLTTTSIYKTETENWSRRGR